MNQYEDRIIELETKVSYQEDSIQQLNDVVTSQQNKLDQCQLAVQELHKRLLELTDGSQPSQNKDERPPHY